jgi:hypothetical protein
MKRLLTTTAIVCGALWFHPPTAHAALVSMSNALGNCGSPGTCEGITYTLEMSATAGNPTANFALTISGENTASDTKGGIHAGRTGVESFALGDPAGDVSTASVSSPTGYTFVDGGLSNSGSPSGDCNGSGSFFCFHDTAITNSSPASSGTLVFDFSVTVKTGDWSGYTNPAFKINWVGSANNYDLVSQDIPVNTTCPDCVINPTDGGSVPEPASIAILGLGVLGIGAVTARKRR